MYKTFDIVRAEFPFSDIPMVKERPAIVISSSEYHEISGLVVCCMVTSRKSDFFTLDFELEQSSKMGLPKKCYARPEKIFSIDEKNIVRKEGILLIEYCDILVKRLNLLLPFKHSAYTLHEKQTKFIKK